MRCKMSNCPECESNNTREITDNSGKYRCGECHHVFNPNKKTTTANTSKKRRTIVFIRI